MYVNEKGELSVVSGFAIPLPFVVMVTLIAPPPNVLFPTVIGMVPHVLPPAELSIKVDGFSHVCPHTPVLIAK